MSFALTIVGSVYVVYVSVSNFKESAVTCKLPMGKLVGVVKHVDVRECMVCTMYVMYVSMGNFKESVVTCKLFMGKLVAKTWTARTSLYFRGRVIAIRRLASEKVTALTPMFFKCSFFPVQ